MRITKTCMVFLLGAPLTLGIQAVKADAQPQHLYEAAQENRALKAAFEEIMAPVVKASPWLKSYGTTAPPTAETIDTTDYKVYWGCKPHDCISESYAVLYEPVSKKIVAGAFVRNTFDGPTVVKADISWLGETDWDRAKVLGKYLY